MEHTRRTLIAAIASYPVNFKEEEKFRDDFLVLLSHPDAFQRTHLPGHITGSAWIVNTSLTKTVLILHAKLGRWLQPGGHADGEENVLNAAVREAQEETGLVNFGPTDGAIFDLDIHPIPDRKDFPAHLHYDIRFLLYADEAEPLVISDESTGLKWVPLEAVGDLTHQNPGMMRLVAKTLALKNDSKHRE